VELLQNEEATGHAHAPRDSVSLGGRGTYHLEEILGDAEVLLRVLLLAEEGVYNRLEDVLFGDDAVHVFNQLVSFINFLVFQMIDDQVKSSFWDHIHNRG